MTRATSWRRPPGRVPRWPTAGFDSRPVAKLGDAADDGIGEVPILDLIRSGEVRLVVNTPTPRSGVVRDAAEIRHAATAEGILCLTAIETGGRRRGGARPGDRRAARRGPVARVVGAGGVGRSRVTDGSSGRIRPRAAQPAVCTTIAWPSDQRVSVVSPTITTASGSCSIRSAREPSPGAADSAATT